MSDRNINIMLLIIIAAIAGFYILGATTAGQVNKVNEGLIELRQQVEKGNWGQAQSVYTDLESTWSDKTSYWIAVNYAEADFSTFDDTLARLKSSIEAKDKQTVMEQINAMQALWLNFTKPIPQP